MAQPPAVPRPSRDVAPPIHRRLANGLVALGHVINAPLRSLSGNGEYEVLYRFLQLLAYGVAWPAALAAIVIICMRMSEHSGDSPRFVAKPVSATTTSQQPTPAVVKENHPRLVDGSHTDEQAAAAYGFSFKSHFSIEAEPITFLTEKKDMGRHALLAEVVDGPNPGETLYSLSHEVSVDDAGILFLDDSVSCIMLHYGPQRIRELGGLDALLKTVLSRFGNPDKQANGLLAWEFKSVERRIAWNEEGGGGIRIVALQTRLMEEGARRGRERDAANQREKASPGF